MTAMTGQSDRARFTSMLRDSIASLCKNGLMFDSISSVEGLIGITLNTQEVFLVNIKEQLLEASISLATGNNEDPSDKEVVSDDQGAQPSSTHRKRRKRRGSKSSVSEITPYSMSTDTSSVNVSTIDNTVATAMTMPDANSLIVIDEIRVKTEHAEQIAEEAFHVQSHDQYLQPNSDGNTTSSSTCVPSTSYVQDTSSALPNFGERAVVNMRMNSADYFPSRTQSGCSTISFSQTQSSGNILMSPEVPRSLPEPVNVSQGWQHQPPGTGRKCPICGKAFLFTNEAMLLDHLQTCKGTYKSKQFVCPVCGVTRNSKTTLKVHIESIHSGQKFVCQGCGKKFNHRSSRSRHIIMGTCNNKASPNRPGQSSS